MQLLKDILVVLGVTGQEMESVLRDIHSLALSRGARRLVARLSQEVRSALNKRLTQAASQKHLPVIRNTIREHFNFQQRQEAYVEALGEIIEKEFLPAVLAEATETQRRKIQRIIVGDSEH